MISANMLTMLQHQREKKDHVKQKSIIYGVRLREMCKEIKRNMSKKESVIERHYIESVYFYDRYTTFIFVDIVFKF